MAGRPLAPENRRVSLSMNRQVFKDFQESAKAQHISASKLAELLFRMVSVSKTETIDQMMKTFALSFLDAETSLKPKQKAELKKAIMEEE